MKYIVGTEITIRNTTGGKIRPGMTSQQIKAASSGNSKFGTQRALFTPGKEYVLNRIYTRDEKVIYRFARNFDDIVEVDFNSVSDAEKFISEARGESIAETIDMERTD